MKFNRIKIPHNQVSKFRLRQYKKHESVKRLREVTQKINKLATRQMYFKTEVDYINASTMRDVSDIAPELVGKSFHMDLNTEELVELPPGFFELMPREGYNTRELEAEAIQDLIEKFEKAPPDADVEDILNLGDDE